MCARVSEYFRGKIFQRIYMLFIGTSKYWRACLVCISDCKLLISIVPIVKEQGRMSSMSGHSSPTPLTNSSQIGGMLIRHCLDEWNFIWIVSIISSCSGFDRTLTNVIYSFPGPVLAGNNVGGTPGSPVIGSTVSPLPASNNAQS